MSPSPAPTTTVTKTPGERMLTVCMGCDRIARERRVTCAALGRPIVELAARGRRFCPMGLHDGITPGRGRIPVVAAPRVPRVRWPRLWFYATGATKLTLSLLYLCRTPADTLAVRRAACRLCSKLEHKRLAGLIPVRICGICRCWLWAKTALATERCPLNGETAWRAAEGKRCGLVRRLPLVGRVLTPRGCGGCGGSGGRTGKGNGRGR